MHLQFFQHDKSILLKLFVSYHFSSSKPLTQLQHPSQRSVKLQQKHAGMFVKLVRQVRTGMCERTDRVDKGGQMLPYVHFKYVLTSFFCNVFHKTAFAKASLRKRKKKEKQVRAASLPLYGLVFFERHRYNLQKLLFQMNPSKRHIVHTNHPPSVPKLDKEQ